MSQPRPARTRLDYAMEEEPVRRRKGLSFALFACGQHLMLIDDLAKAPDFALLSLRLSLVVHADYRILASGRIVN